MQHKSMLRSLVLLAAVAVSIPAFAKPVSKDLPISRAVQVGKSDVQAGDYHIVINDNHLTLMKGKKTIAESDGKWEDRDQKNRYTEVVSDGSGKVTELRFAGQKSAFVLNQ